MEFIRTLREKHQTARQADIQQQAEEVIRIADFADSLFIAFNGVPLFPIEESWTSKEILQQLTLLRDNYIKAKMKGNNYQQITAVF